MLIILIFVMIAYLLGSLSSAIIFSKFFGLQDPRTFGSGNAGATNVLRSGNRKAALFVLLGDALKGLVIIWLGKIFGVTFLTLNFMAIAGVLGHIFPIYFKFKGGKGVATTFGIFFGLSIVLGLFAAIVWGIVAYLVKYVSIASMAAAVTAFIVTLIVFPYYLTGVFIIMLIVIASHFKNIQRLLNRTEPQLKL